MTPPIALTIAGSDSGGGAGIQADLATFAALGVHGTSVVTALTAQNTLTTAAIHVPPITFLDAQLDAVLDDLPPTATKTGMLATAAIIRAVAARAATGQLPNLIVDPVMISTAGTRLLDTDALDAYAELLPHALAVTPNAHEAAALTGSPVAVIGDAIRAARSIAAAGPQWVVIKGGHLQHEHGNTTTVIYERATNEMSLLRSPWIDTLNTHGTGCTFAAAMTAAVANGASTPVAIRSATDLVQHALQQAKDWHLGAGTGPIAHTNRQTGQ